MVAHLNSLGTAMLAFAALSVAQQQPPTFSTRTQLVTVAVAVTDRGRPVAGLTADDFEVLSDDKPAKILQFTSDPGPVTVALLLDASGSMAVNSTIGPAGESASALLRDLTAGRDRAGIFTFDKAIVKRLDFGPIGPGHTDALKGVRAFGSTSLFDAVRAAGEATASDASPRRGLVVFTDGIDTSSRRTAAQVQSDIAAVDVPVYIIEIVPPAESQTQPESAPVGNDVLSSLADGTGGRHFEVSPGTPMVRARASILTDLRHHYLIAFEPDSRPGWHSLSVRTRQKHTVRARAGYSVRS